MANERPVRRTAPAPAHALRPAGVPRMIIGPNAVILGYVLKSIPNSDFSMKTFGDRLRLQKIVYMVEAFGVYLGYDFSWYLRGPYCTNLARTGFELEQIMDRIPDGGNARFLEEDIQRQFDRCVKFIGSIMNSRDDLDGLEIAASIHLLAKTPGSSKREIFDRVVSKMPESEARRADLLALCEKMWDNLSAHSLLSDKKNGQSGSGDPHKTPKREKYSIKAVPESIGEIKDAMIEKQQYGDVALAVTLKDIYEHNQDLEPNYEPAFTRRPSHVAQLVSDTKRNELLTYVTRQYW